LRGLAVDGVDVLRPTAAADIASGKANNAALYPLVPFSNRIRDGRLVFEGEQFQLARNWPGVGHPMHGDGWAQAWAVVRSDGASAEIAYLHERAGKSRRLAVPLSRPAVVPAGRRPADDPDFPREPRGSARAGRHRAASVLLAATPTPNSPAARRRSGAPMRGAAGRAHRRAAGLGFQRRPQVNSVTLDNCFDGWDGRAAIVWPRVACGSISRRPAVPPSRDLRPAGQAFFCVEPVSHAKGQWACAARTGGTLAGEVVLRFSNL
jgi:aldose 1-epimerase